MPRLSYPAITKAHAIDSLLKLYRDDQGFVEELEEIRDPYLDLIIQYALDSFDFAVKSELSPREFFDRVINRTKNQKQGVLFFPQTPAYLAQLQPYFDALNKLAYRWKLRAPWAAPMLIVYDMFDVLKIKGLIPDQIDLPLEKFSSLYPWTPPVPALEIKVPGWAIILQGREEVLKAINKKLRQYEEDIKAAGLKEYPSSLKKHARWWFEYFVHGKRYDDIAQEEIYAPGGSLVSYARNVGEAIRGFSRLIGIDTRNLKGDS
jgi:hypothetical protein